MRLAKLTNDADRTIYVNPLNILDVCLDPDSDKIMVSIPGSQVWFVKGELEGVAAEINEAMKGE